MSDSVILGSVKAHFHSQGDTTGRCPSCYTNSVQKIGVLSIDGAQRDVHKCNNCNRLFSGSDGGIRSLVDEARKVFKTENVGFVAINSTDTSYSTSNTQCDPQDIINSTNNIKNEVQQLRCDLQNLTNVIRDMAIQNHDLMEKLMTDPLNGLRKSISDFNLE